MNKMETIKRVDNSYPRYLEHLAYIAQTALLTLEIIGAAANGNSRTELGAYICWGILGGLYLLAAVIENLRLVQIPGLLSFIAYSIVAFIDVGLMNSHKNRILALVLLGVGLLLSLWLRYVFGNVNFSKYPEFDAPYKAGYKTFRTSRYGNEVCVFYPISKDTEVKKETDVDWLPHGDKTLKGLLMLSLKRVFEGKGPTFMIGYLRGLKIGVVRDAPLDESFKTKKVTPIFFSHGLTASAHLYSQVLRDLARHGYMVFAICHQDGSCLHTVNAKGKDMYHGPWKDLEILELRKQQLPIREHELLALIDEVIFTHTK